MEGGIGFIVIAAGTINDNGLNNRIRGGVASRVALGQYRITLDQELDHFDGVFLFAPTTPSPPFVSMSHVHVSDKIVDVITADASTFFNLDVGFHFLFARIPWT